MRIIAHESEFPKNTPIFLFGAGGAGLAVRKALASHRDIALAGFIDNNKKGQTVDGLPVTDLDGFLASRPDNAAIVITSTYFKDIARQLRGVKFTNYFNGYPFYETLMDRRLLRKGYALWAALLTALAAAGWALYRWAF